MLGADVRSDEHGELHRLGSCEIVADSVGLGDSPSILREPPTRPRVARSEG
jgi:hypothetical protein